MNIRDRVVELRRVPAGELLPNPKNWRAHPKAQQDALRGVLADIGFAGALLARDTGHGLMLIDGHLRAETAPEMAVPVLVLVLDLDEAEADLLLATYDPLGAMAEANAGKLAELMAGLRDKAPGILATLTPLPEPGLPTWAAAPTPTAAQLERRGDELGRTFTERSVASAAELVGMVCPDCGSEFSVRAGDIGRVSAGTN